MFINVSKIFLSMLQVHSDKESKEIFSKLITKNSFLFYILVLCLWILAAKYEFEEINKPDQARSLMQRALRFLPKSKKIWLEVIKNLICN